MVRATTLHKVAAHDEGVWSLAWVPSGATQQQQRVLTGSVDETVRVWDVPLGGGEGGDVAGTTPTTSSVSLAHTYAGQTLGVVSVAVDPSGEYAAASALDSTVRVWSLRDGAPRAAVEAPPTETWGVSFCAGGGSSGDGSLLLAVAGGTTGKARMHRIDAAAGSSSSGSSSSEVAREFVLPATTESATTAANPTHTNTTLTGSKPFVLAARASPDGASRLAASAMDGTVALFDSNTGALLHTLKGHHRPVRSVAWTPDGRHVLTACDDAHAHLYDAHSGALVEAFSGHGSWVLDVAVDPASGAYFATASSDSRVRLFDLGARQLVQTLTEHGDQVWGVAFGSDGKTLASAGDDKQLVVYAVA
jgi:WD repeat-containing protein 61